MITLARKLHVQHGFSLQINVNATVAYNDAILKKKFWFWINQVEFEKHQICVSKMAALGLPYKLP